jgi:hypothetical protein
MQAAWGLGCARRRGIGGRARDRCAANVVFLRNFLRFASGSNLICRWAPFRFDLTRGRGRGRDTSDCPIALISGLMPTMLMTRIKIVGEQAQSTAGRSRQLLGQEVRRTHAPGVTTCRQSLDAERVPSTSQSHLVAAASAACHSDQTSSRAVPSSFVKKWALPTAAAQGWLSRRSKTAS